MAKIVSFSLDKESTELLKNAEKLSTFKNRSDLIRSALHLLINEWKEVDSLKGHVSAIIVVTHSEKNDEEIARINHQFSDVITTQIHNNFHENCMETFILHGKVEIISSFLKTLKQNKSVTHARLMVVADQCL